MGDLNNSSKNQCCGFSEILRLWLLVYDVIFLEYAIAIKNLINFFVVVLYRNNKIAA